MAVKDFRANENRDIIADSTGDIAITESDGQHLQDLCYEMPGSYKMFPLIGAGLPADLNSLARDKEMLSKIRVTLESDNYKINVLKYDKDNEIETDAERIEKI